MSSTMRPLFAPPVTIRIIEPPACDVCETDAPATEERDGIACCVACTEGWDDMQEDGA